MHQNHDSFTETLPDSASQVSCLESIGEAAARALAGREPPPDWGFILAPEPLSMEEWQHRQRPSDSMLPLPKVASNRGPETSH